VRLPPVDEIERIRAKMSPEDRERFDRLIRAQFGGEPLGSFIKRHIPSEPPQRHMLPIIKLFERARHERIFAAISMPPRHGKTVTIQRGLGWLMRHQPADLNAYVTYSTRKAESKARAVRQLAQRSGVQLDPHASALAEMRTLQGGGLMSVGAAAGLTGVGVSGVMVFDDPYANRKQADSIVIRESIWEIFTEVVFTRLEQASVIVVHTRWHEDDLIGRLFEMHSKGELPSYFPWEFINLPAIAEEDDYLGREPGEALWPERFSVEELRGIEMMNPWSFAALYQGRPRPRGSALFGEPAYYDPAKTDLTGCRVYIGADPAATESTASDKSVAVVLATRGVGPKRVAYVLDVLRHQEQIPLFVKRLRALSVRWYGAPINVEAVAGFKAVPQMLKQIDPGLPVTEAPVLGDKRTRAEPAAAAWNQGRLLLPMGNVPWVQPFKRVVKAFTGVGDAEDDDVDALAHGWNAADMKPKTTPRGSVRQRS
jgi:predicted phage terminase large subunit-like protein